ncbi:MAG: hypothetical protein KCHDKBKB_00863 [Elusimicrobia bacterium]|nr:hypothetical protein [Elusimicrobiota bacterium]
MTESTQDEQRLERERYGKILRQWHAALKNMQLYSVAHPSMAEASRKVKEALEEVLKTRFDLSYEHVDGLFMVGDILLIEESLAFYDLLKGFEDTGIHKISFLPGINESEIIDLCSFLLQAQNKTPGVRENKFNSEHIRTLGAPESHKEGESEKIPPLLDLMKAEQLSQEWLELIEKSLTRLLDEQIVSAADLSIPLENLIDGINQHPAAFSFLICTRLSKNHVFNSMVLALFLGHQLGLDTASLKTLGLSALLHDTGRIFLPSDLSKSTHLTSEDQEIIRLHTRDGAAFLAGVQGLAMGVVRVALEHHIHHDGKGYPSLPEGQKPHLFSQIVALADFVSWGTVSLRQYHKPVQPHRLIRSVLRRANTQFHPLLVKFFLPFFGLYPPGTLVRLSTGERAVVVKINPHHIARPVVIVLGPTPTMRLLDTSLVEEGNDTVFPVSIVGCLGYEPNTPSLFRQITPAQPS